MREASSRGAALLALERLGAIDNVETMPVGIGHTYEPDPEDHDPARWPPSRATAATTDRWWSRISRPDAAKELRRQWLI